MTLLLAILAPTVWIVYGIVGYFIMKKVLCDVWPVWTSGDRNTLIVFSLSGPCLLIAAILLWWKERRQKDD